MAEKQRSNVDQWLERETPRIRKALESASRHFDANDNLTVNTLEAVYGQESSFGALLGTRGSTRAAGHFHLKPTTAERYGLNVSKTNLKDLHTMFGKRTKLLDKNTVPVKDISERKKFVIGAYNAGEGRIANAQYLAEKAGDNPQLWSDVQKFLESAGATETMAKETRQYVEKIPLYEMEFSQKSPTNKNLKHKEVRTGKYRCTEGRWRTIDDKPVFICA